MASESERRGQIDRFVKDMTRNGMSESRAREIGKREAVKADRKEAAKKR